jgi:hypothetical protein
MVGSITFKNIISAFIIRTSLFFIIVVGEYPLTDSFLYIKTSISGGLLFKLSFSDKITGGLS